MDALVLEMSIMNDQFKIETIALEHELFMDLMYQNNTVLTEEVTDTFKKIVGIIKEKLIALKNKFLKAINFVKDKIKEFISKFKKESFEFVNNIGSGKIMAGEKIKLSEKDKLYDIQKISAYVDGLYNNKYVRNIKVAINSSNNVINYLNTGKFESMFTEINASKDKTPQLNTDREKFATGDTKVEITDNYKLNKDTITGKEAADYIRSINKFTDNITKYIDSIFDINEKILKPSIKVVSKLVVTDSNKIHQMNLQEVKFQKGLVDWIRCINSWTTFGLSYSNIFTSILEQVCQSIFTIIDKAKTLSIKMNKEEKQN